MKRARTERPENFEVDLSHPLMRGAVLLGLGQAHHSLRYRDESGYAKHGTLFGSTPAGRWGRALGRASLGFAGTPDYVRVPCFDVIGTVAMWLRPVSGTNGFGCLLDARNNGDSGTGYIFWNTDTTLLKSSGTTYVNGKLASLVPASVWSLLVVTGFTLVSGMNPKEFVVGTHSNYTNHLLTGAIEDYMIWSRILSPAEIMQLADPSNVMLSGAIREPRPRRSFVGQVAAKPWLYAHRRSSRVIGVGI